MGEGVDEKAKLGEEPLVLFSYNERPAQHGPPQFFYNPQTHRYEQTTAPPEQKFSLLGIPPWTRGVNRVHVGPLWGSPFGPSLGSDEQLSDSNPNGLRDGLVLVLSGSSNN